jgi:hypothetical protein
MKINWKVFGESGKVRVGRENPHPVAHGNRADEQIGWGALQAITAADVVKAGCGFVILFVCRKVGVESKIFLQLVETLLWLRSRQQLLADWAEQLDDICAKKFGHLRPYRIIGWPVAPKELRPDAGVNNDSHGLARNFL